MVDLSAVSDPYHKIKVTKEVSMKHILSLSPAPWSHLLRSREQEGAEPSAIRMLILKNNEILAEGSDKSFVAYRDRVNKQRFQNGRSYFQFLKKSNQKGNGSQLLIYKTPSRLLFYTVNSLNS